MHLLSQRSLVAALVASGGAACFANGGAQLDEVDNTVDESTLCVLNGFADDDLNLESLNQAFDPLNVSIADFASEIRDQGKIVSCASFTMLALLENQLFNDRDASRCRLLADHTNAVSSIAEGVLGAICQ